ncbi:MAG: 3-phosphoshikimate 1-carboxyvinyltransferase [Proteobacteria bacterium]|nr:3-phosphoshikimate 1-carboxyvinyltransferase [Pseudomonadota bacterium]
MYSVKTAEIRDCDVMVPGSKSYTHRTLIASALSDGPCTLSNCLRSEDTLLTAEALRTMGVDIQDDGEFFHVAGSGGRLKPADKEIYLANSGTSMRLLTGVAALGQGTYTLTGTPRMQERPIKDLMDSLAQIGVVARSVKGTGCPPIEIQGGTLDGGSMDMDCSISSQFLSSVLLMAPLTRKGISVRIIKDLVSKPYVDMTIDIMNRLGVRVERDGYTSFHVPGLQTYVHGDYAVEPDCSQASYFWGAAAITGKTIKVKHIHSSSRQGDVKFAQVLEKMGCKVFHEKDGIAVQGGKLKAVHVDMESMPDIVPTLAVVASFAEGTTEITNVAHLKEKECDRLNCVATELIKMGIDARATDSGLIIRGGSHVGAEIETYDDHRMAMCFAISGLRVPGVVIRNEMCVKKSFPNFWEVFEGLYP